MSKNNIKKNNKGFTLMETLVAISVLMLAVAGPLTLAQRSMVSTMISRDQLIASYLAQDALDYVRSISNLDNEGGELLDWGINCGSEYCAIDTVSDYGFGAISNCGPLADDCNNLYFDESSYSYTMQGSSLPQSKFKRYVKFEISNNKEADAKDSLNVLVGVKWKTGGINQIIEIRDQLYAGI